MKALFVITYYQYAILDCTCWGPVEHASAVVFHLCFLKVKILRLVIGDPNFQFAVLLLVRWLVGRPANMISLELMQVFIYVYHICTFHNIEGGDQVIFKGFVHFMFK